MKRLFNLSALIVLASILGMSSSYGQSCDTLRNYTVPGDGMYSVWQGGPDGALLSQETLTAGPDTYEVDLWMEPYNIGTVTKQIRAIRFLPSVIENNSGSASFNLVIYNDNSGTPGTQIASQTVAYDDLNDPMFWNTIELTNAVSVTGTFWVGYQLSYAMPWDKFQLAGTTHIINYTTFHLTGFGNLNNTWHAVNDIYSDENNDDIYSAFALDVLLSNGTVPDPNMTGDNISACLSGAFVNLDASGTTGDVDVYEWWLTDDPATQIYTDAYGVNATLNPTTASPSNQRIYLWANGACVSKGVYAVVTVHPDVTATITPTDVTCEGATDGSIVITNPTGGDASYLYSIDGGATTSSTGTFNNLGANTYDVEVSTAGNGCSYTEQVTVNFVNPQDDASFAYASNTLCLGGTNESPTITGVQGGVFTASGTGLTIDATSGEIDLNASTNGTYDVTYTTNGTCPNTETVSITVTDSPNASFTYNSNEYCSNDGIILPSFATGASAGQFTSTAGLVFVNASTGGIDLNASDAGVYTITNTIAASGSCPEVSETFEITVNELPTVTIDNGDIEACIYHNPIELTGIPAGGTFSGTGVTNNSFDPDAAGEGTHTITYTYEDSEGCENSATIEIEVDGCVGISTNDLNSEVVLSPNPSTDYVDVAVVGNNQVVSIQVISLEGKVMNTRTEAVDAQTTRIDVSSLSTGTYLVQLSTDNGTVTKKMVVQ